MASIQTSESSLAHPPQEELDDQEHLHQDEQQQQENPISSSASDVLTIRDSPHIQIALPYEEFEEDVELRLGRANGNMYQRKPAVPRVNDGQVMVRLKKKRFILLDYTIVPTEADLEYAKTCPHVEIPLGAGRAPCTSSSCSKIGVPIKLYDSDPSQPVSLYLRSGLCFECQRHLNEKRRVDRKRQHPISVNKDGSVPMDALSPSDNKQKQGVPPSILYAIGPCPKKFKMTGVGNVISLHHDAVIINGAPTTDTKTVADGYGFQDFGLDLQFWARQGWEDTAELLAATTTSLSVSTLDVSGLYEKAFVSLNKAIFLLSQWKMSWDAVVEVAQETVDASDLTTAPMADQLETDTVLEAPPPTNNNASMVSLLLAADKDQQLHEEAAAAAAAAAAAQEEQYCQQPKQQQQQQQQTYHYEEAMYSL